MPGSSKAVEAPLKHPDASPLNLLDMGVIIINQQMHVVSWNEWLTAFSGLSLKDVKGQKLNDFFPELEGSRLLQVVENCVETGMSGVLSQKLHRYPLPLYHNLRRRTEENKVHQNISVRPMGEKGCCIVQVVDVTKTYQRELILRDQARKMQEQSEAHKLAADHTQAILDNTLDAIISLDAQGVIKSFNQAAERLFLYQEEDIVGKNLTLLLSEDLSKNIPAHYGKFEKFNFDEALGHISVINCVRKDHSTFPVELGLSMVGSDDEEEPEEQLYICMLSDISKRIIAEKTLSEKTAEIERSNIELEQFAYVVSHDLQEPLRMVTSYLQLLDKKYRGKLDASADKCIHYAVDGATRMKTLISDLLGYSRVGSRGLTMKAVESSDVVGAVLSDLKFTMKECGAEVKVGKLPKVMADKGLYRQLMQNLVANGIKYRGERAPRISISAKSKGRYVTITVSDNGIGISKKDFGRVFGIFQRLHHRHEYEGTGIGLAICKKIVEQHGGDLWLESEVGSGTDFHFSLKLARE